MKLVYCLILLGFIYSNIQSMHQRCANIKFFRKIPTVTIPKDDDIISIVTIPYIPQAHQSKSTSQEKSNNIAHQNSALISYIQHKPPLNEYSQAVQQFLNREIACMSKEIAQGLDSLDLHSRLNVIFSKIPTQGLPEEGKKELQTITQQIEYRLQQEVIIQGKKHINKGWKNYNTRIDLSKN